MTQSVVGSKQSTYHPDFQWGFFATWVMEMFDTWGVCVTSFALAFLSDFLSSQSQFLFLQVLPPNYQTLSLHGHWWILQNAQWIQRFCVTLNLLHMCTHCVHGESAESGAFLKWYAPASSFCQTMHMYFFMANSWFQYTFLPLPFYYPLGDGFQ